ncbi:prefoldin subunit 2 isoform X1 [Homalodisca vitripennis]|uniref:prefoldin subunit 2 isoform X1 n=1 Tax=Homalodisca vitripennis TaxID=197043 RepID=UPI001EEA58DF|nr:prefoldin subunit 2 isoform X1 [Homalodisca vitripennis]
MNADNKKAKTNKAKSVSGDEVYNSFQTLRNEQRTLANKISELEYDLNEHKIVIDTLKDLDGDRKCFRMVGGVLCEKTVKEVLPVLSTNKQQLSNLIDSLNKQLTKKGIEINEYKEKHSIRIKGQDEEESTEKKVDDAPARNVMVNPL